MKKTYYDRLRESAKERFRLRVAQASGECVDSEPRVVNLGGGMFYAVGKPTDEQILRAVGGISS